MLLAECVPWSAWTTFWTLFKRLLWRGDMSGFSLLFAWLFLPALQDNVQESRDQELIVFELITESKMSVEWESPDFDLNAPQKAM